MTESGTPLSEAVYIQIAERLKGAVFLAVLEELEEQIAKPEAIDLGAREAFAFGNGPIEMMRSIPEQELTRLVDLVRTPHVALS